MKRIFDMMDFRTALLSEAEIWQAYEVVEKQRNGLGIVVSDQQYEWCKKVVNAAIHPDTKEIIFFPLRLSCIVPMNLTLDVFMILAKTPLTIIGSQVLNQSYNAMHYYANRNATNYDSLPTRLAAYSVAVTSAVTAALKVNKFGTNPPTSLVNWAPVIKRVGPFIAVAIADVLNVFTMRHNEFLAGISVFNEVRIHVRHALL